jgi:CPA1 family monovalent cation:H+ antiporter
LLFAVFLPGLLFEAAFQLELGGYLRSWRAITLLALPGVVVSMVLTALLAVSIIAVLSPGTPLSWTGALVFGALIAATDPVAVTALFRRLSAPTRLTELVEGESLLNDGTSVVLLTLMVAYTTGAAPTIGGLARDFAFIAAGGLVIGAAVGATASLMIRRIDDSMIGVALTTIAAYGSFVLADYVGTSGVMATVAAGLVCGSFARRVGMPPNTRAAIDTFWQFAAFGLNSVVFLLIGLEVSLGGLVRSWGVIAVAYCAALAARAAVVFAVTLLLRRTTERLPLAWSAILTWGGLRGALSMVLALALPLTFRERDVIETMTVGVVVLTLLLQGITVSPLLTRLRLVNSDRMPDGR